MEAPQSINAAARRRDQDWLTVLATAFVFLFHCARFLDAEDWHVKSVAALQSLTPLMRATTLWLMPLFFLLSGQSAWASLRSRGLGAHLRSRLLRLGLPFAFGVLVLNSPLQVWIERVSHGVYSSSLWEFYPHYFDGFYAFGGNFAWMGLHLWYLGMLLLFSLLACPVLILLPESAPLPAVPVASAPTTPIPATRLLALALGWLPLYCMELAVSFDPHGLGMRAFGGWSPCSYLVVFCLGFLLYRAGWPREALTRLRWLSLPAALATGGALLLAPGLHGSLVLRSAGCWFALLAILGHAARRLDHDAPALAPLREVAMPFYILHQPVIVSMGFLLAAWQAPAGRIYPVLAASALALLIPLCWLVTRCGPLRPFFGLPRRD